MTEETFYPMGEAGHQSVVVVKYRTGALFELADELINAGMKESLVFLKINIFATAPPDMDVMGQEWNMMTVNFKGADTRDKIISACDRLDLEWALASMDVALSPYEPVVWKHRKGIPVGAPA